MQEIENIKPLYEDEEKMLISYSDWAYLEQEFPEIDRTKQWAALTWKGKKVYASRPEKVHIDTTLSGLA